MSRHVNLADVTGLLRVGRDLFLRTGLLLLFLFLATRTATRAGANSGAAHQALRQIWLLTALLLDAYAATSQSLVGYFMGAARIDFARRVAGVACLWALCSGFFLAVAMLLLEDSVARLLVPPSARATFAAAWWIAALAQPINALSFVTDGIHWGTGDYRYLRNGMFVATALGVFGLLAIDPRAAEALALIWAVTAAWTAVRSAVGLVRIWPAPGRSPLRV
jgi:MATE family multidrug resistance protein